MPEVENFIIRPNKFDGFNDLADRVERRNVRADAQVQKSKANKDKLTADLISMADPKERLSGSPYDPHIIKGYYDIISDGAKMIQDTEGMDYNDLIMALGPRVNQLAQYAEKAKVIKQGVDKRLEGVTENSGYDKFKLNQEARQEAFYDENGKLKDITTIDPSIDYVQQTVTKRPHLVTNNKGLDEWMSKQKMGVDSNEIININSLGRKERRKVKQSAYAFAIPEIDDNGVHTRKFIPKYDTAIDAGEDILHNGKRVPLLDETVFNSIINNSPGTKDWLRGQVMQALQSGEFKDANGEIITMSSPQAKNYGRAILFEELKSRGMGNMEDIIEAKEAKIINNNNSGGGTGSDDSRLNNIYERIKQKGMQRLEDYKKGDYFDNALDSSELNNDELEVVVKATQNKDLDPTNIKIIVEDNGRVGVYNKGDGKRLVYLNQTGSNLTKQSGKPGKEASVEKGNVYYAPQTIEKEIPSWAKRPRLKK